MPRMSEINQQNSKYFKVKDLEEATGQPWAVAQLQVVVESAHVAKYKPDDEEDAFFLKFHGHEKLFGCNWTNRKMLEGIVGDVEWDTASLKGTRLLLYAEGTSLGAGVRLRPGNLPAPPPEPQNELHPPPPTDADAPPELEDSF